MSDAGAQRLVIERLPYFVDNWINRWNTHNRDITHAPVLVLTGAGASYPLGIVTLGLPEAIELSGGLRIVTADLLPAAAARRPGDSIDLESLMIVGSVLSVIRDNPLFNKVLGGDRRALTALTMSVQRVMPVAAFSPRPTMIARLLRAGATTADKRLSPEERQRRFGERLLRDIRARRFGTAYLSDDFVEGVITRLLALDAQHGGVVLSGLAPAIHRLIVRACLALRRDAIPSTYGPLLRLLRPVLAAAGHGRRITLPLFTTNYDETFSFLSGELLRELEGQAAASCRIHDATVPNADHPGWSNLEPSGYRRYRVADAVSADINLVLFYLHGSVRWALSEPSARNGYTVIVGDERYARESEHYRVMLLPDAQKVLWGQSHQQFSDLMAPERRDPFRPGSIFYAMRLGYLYFEECLRHARALLVIGYSFRDLDCLAPLLKSWERRNGPRVFLVDPYPDQVLHRLRHHRNVVALRCGFGTEEALARISIALQSCL